MGRNNKRIDKYKDKDMKLKNITFDKNSAEWILEIMDLSPVCHFCHDKINKDNLGGIFDKNKISCSSLPCILHLSDYIEKKERMITVKKVISLPINKKRQWYDLIAYDEDNNVIVRLSYVHEDTIYNCDPKEEITIMINERCPDHTIEFDY